MTDNAKTIEQVKALQLQAKEHKAGVQHHRRALRSTMKNLEALKEFCRANNIGIKINGEGG